MERLLEQMKQKHNRFTIDKRDRESEDIPWSIPSFSKTFLLCFLPYAVEEWAVKWKVFFRPNLLFFSPNRAAATHNLL